MGRDFSNVSDQDKVIYIFYFLDMANNIFLVEQFSKKSYWDFLLVFSDD